MVFSAIYIATVPRWPLPPRYSLHCLAALFALAIADCVVYGGGGATSLWIFVASASGLLVLNSRGAVRVVSLSIAFYVIFSLTGHVKTGDFLGDLLPAVFVGFGMIGLRRQFELTAELSRAREEVAQLAANEERLRLARDMHDLTGQSLSMITLKSELAARLLARLPDAPERDRAHDEIEQVAAVSRQTLHDIREAISGYRRPTLAVEIITARAALTSAGITSVDDAELTLLSGTFDPDAEAALAWCLREAVTNVVRHSCARSCHIGLISRPDSVTLTVRDDGRGHVPTSRPGALPWRPGHPAAGHRRAVRSGSGLRGMSERLSSVGGSLELRPDLRPGFSLVATVPAAQRAAASADVPVSPLGQAVAEVLGYKGPVKGDGDTPSAGAWTSGGDIVDRRDPGAAGRGPGDDPRGPGRRCSAFEDDIEVVAQVGRGDEVVPRRARARARRRAARHRDARHGRPHAAAALRTALPGHQGHHPDHVRAARLPAAGHGVGAVRFIVKDFAGRASWPATIRDVLAGRAGHRPGPGRRGAGRGREPAHPAGARRAARPATTASTIADIAAGLYLSEGTVRNYLSCLHPEDRRPQPDRGPADRLRNEAGCEPSTAVG